MAKRGSSNLGEKMIDYMLGIAIGLSVVVGLLPGAFNNINSLESDTTNFSTAEIALFGVLGILIVVAIIRAFYKRTG